MELSENSAGMVSQLVRYAEGYGQEGDENI